MSDPDAPDDGERDGEAPPGVADDQRDEGAPAPDPAPRKRRKKRRATPRVDEARVADRDAAEPDPGSDDPDSEDETSGAIAPPLDAEGRERPLFVLGFPRHPELDALVAAFEVGDYAHVRAHAPLLAERADDPAVRAAALELRRRLDPDPLAKYLLLAAVALLAFLSLWAFSRGGAR